MPDIRELTTREVDMFRAFRLLSLKESPTAFGASYSQELKLERAEFEKRLAASDDQWVLGAFAGDALVGLVGFGREQAEKVRHRGFIWGMYVDAGRRGQGIGGALLKATLERADKLQGLRNIRLGVTATNVEAQRLYESAGFVRFSIEEEYLFVDGEYYSMVIMNRPTSRLKRGSNDPSV